MSGSQASTSTYTVRAAADTYSRQDQPSRNFGTSVRWSVDGRTSTPRHAFLRFDVPAPPAGESISTVELSTYVSSRGESAGPGPVIHATTNGWTENGLTWANQPARGALVARTAAPYDARTWVTWDVTTALSDAQRGAGGTVSFRLETSEAKSLGFKSREAGTAAAPKLTVTSSSSASGTPTPTAGTTTAAPTSAPTSSSPTSTPTPSPTSTAPSSPATSTEAAQRLGWGQPVEGDEFSYAGAPDPAKWSVYDSAGHAGNGLRRPSAWNVDGNVATVTGDSSGTTGGMSAKFDRRTYGRWEARMRTSARDSEYHPVMILWPDATSSTCAEIDYAEGTGDTSLMHFFLHYGCGSVQTSGRQTVDSTQWHNYAVEWTPTSITGYVDGVEWFKDTNTSHIPDAPMHQTLQLDWFPDGSTLNRSWMQVDWVRVYDLGAGAPAPTATPTATTTPTSSPPPSSSGGDVRLATLGDINPDGNSSATSRAGRIAASIAAWNPTAVAVAGDFQYQYGDCGSLVGEFDRTGWGSLMSKVIGAAGPTHDYTSTASSASDYSRHMEGTCAGQTTGPSLSAQQYDRTIQPYEPHYVDLGSWTVVSMPSAQWRSGYTSAWGAAWAGSALTQWLDSAVAAAEARGDHVAVIEHEPYWSSGTDGHPETEGDAQRPWIDVLDKYDVPLVVGGHQHTYERFHPQNADSTRNDATGTQQFQVSTGGIGLRSFTTTAPNSAVRNADTYGWLQLVLRADGGYTWRFVPVEGSFTDSGSR